MKSKLKLKNILTEATEDVLQKAMELPTTQFVTQFRKIAGDDKVQAIMKAGKTDGSPDDEKISFSQGPVSLKALKPTQSEIGFSQSLQHLLDDKWRSLESILKGTPDMGGPIVVANGEWIIDGHHRWSQAYIGNPDGKIDAINIQTDLNPAQVKNVIHMAIAAAVGEVPSNDAKGENLLNASKDAILKYATDGLKSNGKVVRTWMKFPKLIGTNDSNLEVAIPAIAEYIAENAVMMQKNNKPYSGAPPRSLMPQTDKDGAKGNKWQQIVKSGELNFIDPKPSDVKRENKMNKQSKLKSLIERMVRQEVRKSRLKENFADTVDGFKIEWNSTDKMFIVNSKPVNPRDLTYEWDEPYEGWLIVDASEAGQLNRKEKEALEDFVSGAYNDEIQDHWEEIFKAAGVKYSM